MSKLEDLLQIGRDGQVVVPSTMASELAKVPGRFRVIAQSPALLLLQNADSVAASQRPRVIVAGEITSRMTLLEMLGIVANSGWRAELHVYGPDTERRHLSFDQGALKWGNSSNARDRLGEVLYRKGAITREQLDELIRDTGPNRRFGELCLDRGILAQEELFGHLRAQLEQIFFGTLLIGEGAFVLSTPDESAPPPAHTVHMPIQALLMESVQRIDEMALFRERIPDSSMCPRIKPGGAEPPEDSNAAMVYAQCDGTRSVEDIARVTGLGEFLTTKAMYQLLQQGLVTLQTSPQVDEATVRRLVAGFNTIMRDIFMAVATYGGLDETHATLSAWLHGSGYDALFGARVEEDGGVIPDRVVEAVRSAHGDHAIETVHHALHELAAFALFSASTTLPRDQELQLARDINRRLKAVRL